MINVSFVSRLVFPATGKKTDAPPNTGDYTVPNVNTPKIDSLTLSFEAQTLRSASKGANQ